MKTNVCENIHWKEFGENHSEYEINKMKEMKEKIPKITKELSRLGSFIPIKKGSYWYAGWYWCMKLNIKRKVFHAEIMYSNQMFQVKVCKGKPTHKDDMGGEYSKFTDSDHHTVVIGLRSSPTSYKEFVEQFESIIDLLK